MSPVSRHRGDRRREEDSARRAAKESAWEEVYRLVRRIPRGRVMSYGQIAELVARPLSARAVGWAMHQCPADLPWHRVVNASGGCSTDRLGTHPPGLQRGLLEAEGVRFRESGTLDLTRYRWAPLAPRREPKREPPAKKRSRKTKRR